MLGLREKLNVGVGLKSGVMLEVTVGVWVKVTEALEDAVALGVGVAERVPETVAVAGGVTTGVRVKLGVAVGCSRRKLSIWMPALALKLSSAIESRFPASTPGIENGMKMV